ncbi:MAG: Rpn family recombination-promoting nuclease/putative transposase, partial [Pseudanabaenaceae cyanobacterium]
MRRDSIFYQLFQQFPALLFELLPDPPRNAEGYRFDAVSVKEPRFEIDGVWLPPEDAPGTVYFCEVQFQRDERLYERVFAESLLYFYRHRDRFDDWQAVIIYPSRAIEQRQCHPYRSLLASEQVHRVYLEELGNLEELSVWVAVLVLTTLRESETPAAARYLWTRVQREVAAPTDRVIMEMITTIVSYRFEQWGRAEVEAMLNITFEETRLYRELREEAHAKGLAEGWQTGRQEGRQ